MLKPTTTKSVALATLALLWIGHTTTAVAQEPANIGKGRQYFEKVCAKCHETGVGPVLKGRDLPEATYIIIARLGRNAMPAFRITDIDDDTLIAVAKYLASTPKHPEPGATP